MIKGPAILLTQFFDDHPPFDSLEGISAWAKSLGYIALQFPVRNPVHSFDLSRAAESKDYCAELVGRCSDLEITELATQSIGQLVAAHPAYDTLLDIFADKSVRGNPQARAAWATEQMKLAIKASRNLGLNVLTTFSGSLLWPTVYPWPQRTQGLVELGFKELAARWMPILETAEEFGIDLAYEIHPGEDLHDGITFERFLEATGNHPRVKILYDPSHLLLQCLDYLGYISCYGAYIKAFHVKDAEYNPSPRSGVYGGYQEWAARPGRFRSPGDGQVDFKRVFALLTEAGYDSWAVLEWECCVKDSEQAARESVAFIRSLLIEPPRKAFDDFAGSESDMKTNRKILGLE